MNYQFNKKIIFTIGILILVVINGCTGGKDKKDPITDVDVRKGTQGLTMEFIKGAPPERIYQESEFPISLKLENKGAFDIVDGILKFGVEEAYVDLVGGVDGGGGTPINIEGKSIYSPNGDVEYKEVNAETKVIGAQSETHPSSIYATACYPYNTTFGDSVCVDPDVIGARAGRKVCIVSDKTYAEGQGGPVTITKIETRMLPDMDADPPRVKPHFIIFINNKGNGEVIDKNKINDVCGSSSLTPSDFNNLTVTASLSGKPLNCDPANEGNIEPVKVRLNDKEDMIRCTLERYTDSEGDEVTGIDSGLDAYISTLLVELEYGYTFTISKEILIEKVLTY